MWMEEYKAKQKEHLLEAKVHLPGGIDTKHTVSGTTEYFRYTCLQMTQQPELNPDDSPL